MIPLHRVVDVAAAAVVLAVTAAWLVAGTGDAERVTRLAAVAVAAVVCTRLVLRMPGARRTAPRGIAPRQDVTVDAFEAVWWRATSAQHAPDPPERDALQRLVRLAVANADDAHERLRPVLRDLADARCEAVLGTHPDRDPRAAEHLGPAAWAWLRPDRPEPPDRHARGPAPAELDQVVTALERLGRTEEDTR